MVVFRRTRRQFLVYDYAPQAIARLEDRIHAAEQYEWDRHPIRENFKITAKLLVMGTATVVLSMIPPLASGSRPDIGFLIAAPVFYATIKAGAYVLFDKPSKIRKQLTKEFRTSHVDCRPH